MTLLELKMRIEELPIEFLTHDIELIKINETNNFSRYKFGGFVEGVDEWDEPDGTLLFTFEETKIFP
jgi:hypothetical protein